MNITINPAPPLANGGWAAVFAPELFIPNGITDVSFYEKAFSAVELRRFGNDDGSIHVSEFSIGGTLFHLHEQTRNSNAVSPDAINGGTTVVIGLFVDDVHAVVAQAVAAGAIITSPVQDYDYGYRQGSIRDPFGHLWQIQKAI
ncbi:VOC family protein [Mucilaginibacter sp. ZT4R22]|uniref:VOC family protein n=1 Tax=Mucilaginibacter pankratovii TaxID=2772110 RepID=A0ABR7WN28_9SPHI|nr:VOC family protein [Mucilaginibacter pankratovii]MBD1363558.1 VOC family protein [Mucilaginibacter pankratovii]